MLESKEGEPNSALNVVLLPGEEAKNKALTFSYQVTRTNSSAFQLDNYSHLPHISLYQGYYPERNVDELILRLMDIAQDSVNISIEMDGFHLSRGGFVWWNAVNSAELQALHERILEQANPLREGLIAPNIRDMIDNLSDEEKDMVEKTGSVVNRELFSPHITLARLMHVSQNPLACLRGYDTNVSFSPTNLVVADMGQHGTVSKIVEKIPLVR